MKKGKVWLVGAGPSDAGLFTIKGKHLLEQAEVVVYDKLVGQGILAMIPKNAEKINVGKVSGNHLVPQEQINEILLQKAEEGKRVVRLKGGDPFLFGRGGEELELLVEHKIPFEIVPGITSAISVPAYNGIPVTHRDYCSSVHIITAHKKRGTEDTLDYKKLVELDGTLIFLMGVAALGKICKGLIEAGMDSAMPAAILEKGTTAKQRRVIATIFDLEEKAKQENIQTPAIIVIGKVCLLSEQFHWAEDRELGGARVLVTRPKRVSSRLIQKLSDMGAEVIELPAIETIPVVEEQEIEKEVNIPFSNVCQMIDRYAWIIFTSEAAVTFFFQALFQYKKDIRSLNHIKFAVVGPATKRALEEKGIFVDYMPDKYDGESLGIGLAAYLESSGLLESECFRKQKPILVVTPKEKESSCAAILKEKKIPYQTTFCYETVYTSKEEIELEETDYVAFTSASTVKGFVNMMQHVSFETVQAICIGEQTAKEARKYGMKVSISEKATIDALVEAIVKLHHEKKEIS